MHDLDTDAEENLLLWEQELAEKKAKYDSYSENLKRAINELELFYYPKYNKKHSVSKLKDIFINARKKDYANKQLTHDTNISDEDFIIGLEYWGISSVTLGRKVYYKCRLNPNVQNVLEENDNLFIFVDDDHKYNNINIIECEICKLLYDKNKECKKINTKDHLYRQWILEHNLTISKYAWEKEFWKNRWI